jgi:large subunit ribosomal protein L10
VSRAERQEQVDGLRQELASVRNAYLVEFAGLKVDQVNDLRRKVRQASGRYRVVKNRLAIRAVDGSPLGDHAALFDGPTAVAYGDDPVGLAKVLAEFQKNAPIKVKGVLLEGRSMPAAALEGIVSLPTRPELISRFAGMLRSPLVKFVMVLKAPVRDFASVLRLVADKKAAEKGPSESQTT